MEASFVISAAYRGDLDTIKAALSQGFDPNTRDDNGNIAIVAAASRGEIASVELLLQSGADPNQKFMSSSALTYAVREHNQDLLYVLLSQANFDAEVVENAFAEAAAKGYSDFVLTLLETGINLNGQFLDGNALKRAASEGHTETVELLLAKGADPNAVDRNGGSILMRLANQQFGLYASGCVTAIEALISHGADPFSIDKDGFNVLTRSARSQKESVIVALANSNVSLTGPDRNGNTALEVAIDAGNTKIVQLLLQLGADVNVKGRDGQPPIIRSITGSCYQKKKMLDLLIKHGADTKATDQEGHTAYEKAMQAGQKSLVRVLQDFEPNLFQNGLIPTQKLSKAKVAPSAVQLVPSAPRQRVLPVLSDKGPEKNKTNVLEAVTNELSSLTGLVGVKKEVCDLANFLRVQQFRKDKGLSSPEQSLHMVLTGNSGTGKTTVAKLLTEVYAGYGVLTKGQFIKVGRVGIAKAYFTQTVDELVQRAVGGVLYIDKAHLFADDVQDADVAAALDAVMEQAEDYRDDLIVIVAGYTEPMQKFIRSNPGLQSRFNKFLHFDDYAPAELTEIFRHFAASGDYELHPATELKLTNVFSALYARRDETFGNARLARNLFEKSINAHANRMVSVAVPDEESLVTLYPEDIPNA